MPDSAARTVIVFAAFAHALHHVITALFITIVLVLTAEWQQPYDGLIALWTLGAFLLGAAAPLAGWLSDRMGETRVMIAFFFGIGASSIAAGLVDGPRGMQIALAAIGLFGAIYHPVGTAWVVRHAAVKGRAIAIVGSAGSLGVAIASLIAGALNDLVSWRVAFILPGAVAVAGGLALCYAARCGAVPDANVREHTPMDDPDPGERQGARQTIIALVVAMMLTAVVWYAFSTMLPKWLGAALEDRLSPGLTSIGGLIAVILLIGVPAQFLGGALADRGWAREAYVAGFAVKLSALLLALGVGGWPVLAAAGLIVVAFDVTAPIENYLIARYAPRGRRGLAYGLRFGVTIIAGPVGVWLVSLLYREGPRGFDHLLWVLSAIVVVILVVSLLILRDRRPAAATAAIGEANALAVGRKSSEAAQT